MWKPEHRAAADRRGLRYVYRPWMMRHLEGAYAARAAGGSWLARMASGGLNPCRWMSQVEL